VIEALIVHDGCGSDRRPLQCYLVHAGGGRVIRRRGFDIWIARSGRLIEVWHCPTHGVEIEDNAYPKRAPAE
jgi:hypothetical protein